MQKMRERFEASAQRRTPRVLALLLLALMVAWIASASLLDKRWHEVLLDVVPYALIVAALLRMPYALSAIGERMKTYEQEMGDGEDDGDEGPPPPEFAL